jgi:hypothetical protein
MSKVALQCSKSLRVEYDILAQTLLSIFTIQARKNRPKVTFLVHFCGNLQDDRHASKLYILMELSDFFGFMAAGRT